MIHRAPNSNVLAATTAAAIVILVASTFSHSQDPAGPTGGPAVGWLLDASETNLPVEATAEAPRDRTWARIVAQWSEVESKAGVFEWDGIERDVERLRAAGVRVALCVTGTNPIHVSDGGPPTPYLEGSLVAWSGFVRSAVRRLGGRVEVLEIWDGPALGSDPRYGPEFGPDVYAFVLKTAALAARAEARNRGTEIRIAQGALDLDSLAPDAALAWQRAVWEADSSAYIDVLPVRFRVRSEEVAARTPAESREARDLVARLQREALEFPPAPEIWAYLDAIEPDRSATTGWRAVAGALKVLETVATAAFVRTGGDETAREVQSRWMTGFQARLDEGYAPGPGSAVRFEDADGRELQGPEVVAQYFSDESFSAMLVYDTSAVTGGMDRVGIRIPSTFVRDTRTVDPATGQMLRAGVTGAADDAGARIVRVPTAPHPMLLLYQAAAVTPGFELEREDLEVDRERELTAEEIIARHQQVQQVQDDLLDRWIARTRLDYHFKLAQGGGTVDVTVESNDYWERGGFFQREQTDYWLNGNKITWKKIPQLPLIQPEKVQTLPLDLTLDRTYVYRKVGDGRVGDRRAYILAFEPEDPDAGSSLYSGRVWIDRETFVRLRTSLVQTNLEPPVTTNEEVDTYREVVGPNGNAYWLLDRIDGQQVWIVGGRNLVVRREFEFLSYEVNPAPETFRARRERSLASTNQMLQDTDEGLRYLEPSGDGERTLRMQPKTSQLFAAAGAFQDNSSDGVVPLAGVNYFNYEMFGGNTQTNVLFAGPFLFGTLTRPEAGGSRIDLTLDVGLNALKFDDKVYLGGEERIDERIRARRQTISGRLGIPFAKFYKITFVGTLQPVQYFDSSEARDFRDAFGCGEVTSCGFVLPENHLLTRGTVDLEMNRRGFTVIATSSWARRSDWDPWGLVDETTGEFVDSEYDPTHDGYHQWGVSLFKEWYLPKFQKVRGEVNYLDGSDLDRFSRYEFSFFGDDRLNGFSGSGVKFDRGLVARAGYAFNLFEVIRLDATVETAWVEPPESPGDPQSFTGLGFSGNVVGPWKTVINLNWGIALRSDIPDLEGDQEFLLLILKLF